MNRNEWQPIESAPKDGDPIIAWSDGLTVVWWMNDMWEDDDPHVSPRPTHWMRLGPPSE